MDGIIANEKDINDELLWNYFRHQNSSFLPKYLTRATQTKNEKLVNNVKDGLIDLRNAIIKKEISENKNPNKIVDIVKRVLHFKKQRERKAVIILIPKQMFQRLPIALTQVKASNTSENLLSERRQVIYSLHWGKKVKKLLKAYITIQWIQ